MQSLDLIVLEQAIKMLQKDEVVWLCTVIHTYGSAPRSPGSLLCANQQGKVYGSLSGGCIEEDFIKRIARNEFLLDSQIVKYGDGGFEPDTSLPCGGSIDVLVERLAPNQQNLHILQEMQKAHQGQQQLLKTVHPPHMASLNRVSTNLFLQSIRESNGEIQLYVGSRPQLFIACLSPVAYYCIDFAYTLGFRVVVCEHRIEELKKINEMKELEGKFELIEEFPALYLEEYDCSPRTAIVSLTHDPRIDDLTLMEACATPAFYIGAMGSQRTSNKRLTRLKEHGGLSDEDINRIHAPIGLEIGSKTPPEIALAIMADIVRVKNLGNG